MIGDRGGTARVAIDVTAGINQGAGIGRATRSSISALAAHPAAPRLTVFYARERSASATDGMAWLHALVARHPEVHVRRVPCAPRWMTFFWLRHRLPIPVEALVGDVELVLAPDFVAPPSMRARSIVTVHDLSFLTVPQYADPGLRRYLTTAVPPALRRAAHVVAVSETTRQDVIRLLGLSPARVSTVYNGIDPAFGPTDPATQTAMRARLALPHRYILMLGTIEPRKNHIGVLRAFSQIAARLADVDLVIGGRRGWLDQPVFNEIGRLGLQNRVRILGGVSESDLPALYGAATVFAFPSWYEGFGLPALEAMACGTPVVASTASSLPEVCGDAALLVDPADTNALASALERALSEPDLRADLSQRGRQQSARFPWTATADGLIAVIDRLLHRRA